MRWLVPVLIAGCYRAPTPAPPPVVNVAAAHAEPQNPVLVDYKMRGYFFASSEVDKGLGGHYVANNGPMMNGPQARDGVYAHVYLDEGKTLAKGHDAIRVEIVNGSKVPVDFAASDSRLYVVQEALGLDGKWAPIEYLPSSWCGNSYHTLTLPAQSHWEFLAPRYGGAFATKLRIKVSRENTNNPTITPTVFYSNEFDGRINLAQFTVEEGHTASNIMDPYGN